MQTGNVVLNGRYELIERIGSGGMSIVYKATDRSLGRLVAIKMLHESLTGDPDFLRRFRQEAYAAANLAHPNIVTVHDIGQDGHRHFIVMEYVDGRTLKDIIRELKREGEQMSVERVLDLTIQICAGIGYAHRANLVHCDVKPQNVLVTRDDRVKVADFGIARAISEASQQYQASQVWGTPQYFAPEQAAGHPATPASDVYAIGIMMFEMLAGRLPFTAESQTALALKHLQETPPPVTQFNPAVPTQLELIIDKILSKEPAGRYRTGDQLGRILSTYRRNSQAETGPFAPIVRPSNDSFTEMSLPGVPVSEQRTQIFPPDTDTATSTRRPQRKTAAPTAAISESETKYVPAPDEDTASPDWMAIGLGILAVLALLGLIPLWYVVYLTYAG